MGKFILLLVVIAVAIYLVVRLVETRGALFKRGQGDGVRRPPRGPLGPDDDPDFLRDLNRRSRKREEPGSDKD